MTDVRTEARSLRKALRSDDIDEVAEALDSALGLIERIANDLEVAQTIIDMRNGRIMRGLARD